MIGRLANVAGSSRCVGLDPYRSRDRSAFCLGPGPSVRIATLWRETLRPYGAGDHYPGSLFGRAGRRTHSRASRLQVKSDGRIAS